MSEAVLLSCVCTFKIHTYQGSANENSIHNSHSSNVDLIPIASRLSSCPSWKPNPKTPDLQMIKHVQIDKKHPGVELRYQFSVVVEIIFSIDHPLYLCCFYLPNVKKSQLEDIGDFSCQLGTFLATSFDRGTPFLNRETSNSGLLSDRATGPFIEGRSSKKGRATKTKEVSDWVMAAEFQNFILEQFACMRFY